MNSDSRKVVLVGGGAQAKYALETFQLQDIEVVAIIDRNPIPGIKWPEVFGIPVIGSDEGLAGAKKLGATHALLCTADPTEKESQWTSVTSEGFEHLNALHPAAVLSGSATLGSGVIVNAGAVLQPFSRIGDGVIIHSNAVVEHDAEVGHFSNLGPGVCLAGWVNVGRGAVVYTGASVIPQIRIGDRAVVAAGATVITDVPDFTLVAGVPATIKKKLVSE